MPKPQFTDPDGTERYADLDTIPLGALHCLAAGHAWDLLRDVDDGEGASALDWRCVRCARVKSEWLADDGSPVASAKYAGGALLFRNMFVERKAAKLVLRRRLRAGEREGRPRRGLAAVKADAPAVTA